jgi:hypothetical protein
MKLTRLNGTMCKFDSKPLAKVEGIKDGVNL